MEFRYSRHQVPKGTRPDAETDDKLYLIKNVSILHATYQIRLLTYLASKKGKKLIIRVPKFFTASQSLKEFIAKNKNLIEVEKV